MKIGDKLICIKTDYFNNNLVVGKSYQVEKIIINKINTRFYVDGVWYYLNQNKTGIYKLNDYFLSIKEERRNKLNKINDVNSNKNLNDDGTH